MKVALFEDNMLFSVRIKKGLELLGHEAVLIDAKRGLNEPVDLAILHLGSKSFDVRDTVANLRDLGVATIGHAGHGEAELLKLGREVGCSRVVANSFLVEKLGDLFPQSSNSR